MSQTADPGGPGRPGLLAMFSREDRVMGLLLIFVVATLLGPYLHLPTWILFFISVGAVVPLAGFVGSATEALADRLGARVGGLFNATFGNTPDLLVGIIGVQKGLIVLVKATLVGALISNSALIMGLCYIAAGLKHRRPTFNRHEAGHHSVLMMLTVAAILFPSIGSYVTCGSRGVCSAQAGLPIQQISVGIAIVLLVAYLAYLVYGVLGFEALRGVAVAPREMHFLTESSKVQHKLSAWPVWFAIVVLAAAALTLIPVINVLTDSVAPVTQTLGLTEVFVGMVIVGNAGNVAEAYAAIRFSLARPGSPHRGDHGDSGLDLAIGIASASSIQIAAFIAPVVVIYSLFAQPMNLVFSPIEIGILGLLVLVFTYTAQDGESNWLEGAQLVALYLMAAVVFFYLPASAF
ncbi:MAG: calcium/proton exchanger [Candidatus Dormibacteraeota bacterium]|nr:calcium/proton exchanger [Candidatus Dormibacteraeota bacterium]